MTTGPPGHGGVAPAPGWAAPKGFAPDGRRLGSRGRRMAGLLVDGLVALIPTLIALAIALAVAAATYGSDASVTGAGAAAFLLAYATLLVVSVIRVGVDAELVHRHAATLGMGWLGLVAVDAGTGGQVSRGRAWGRALLGTFVSGQLGGLGYWWAFLDPRRRTLHDLVAGTVIVDARDFGPERPFGAGSAEAFGAGGAGRPAMGGGSRWPPRWALPTVAGLAVAAVLACAGTGTALAVAHSNVSGPLDATRGFFRHLAGGADEAELAVSCRGGAPDAEVELPARLTRLRWTGATDLLETDLRPFDLSASSTTVTGALSTYSGPGGEREFKPLIVQLRKEEERWRVCEVEIL